MAREPKVLFQTTRHTMRPLVFVLALAALGGLAILVLESSSDRFLGLAVAAVCGGVAWLGVRRTGKGTVTVVEDGIEHPNLGLIPWGDITRVGVANSTIGRLLTIDVQDRAAYERRQSSLALRWLMRIERALRRPMLSLPEKFLTGNATELRDELEERRAAVAR